MRRPPGLALTWGDDTITFDQVQSVIIWQPWPAWSSKCIVASGISLQQAWRSLCCWRAVDLDLATALLHLDALRVSTFNQASCRILRRRRRFMIACLAHLLRSCCMRAQNSFVPTDRLAAHSLLLQVCAVSALAQVPLDNSYIYPKVYQPRGYEVCPGVPQRGWLYLHKAVSCRDLFNAVLEAPTSMVRQIILHDLSSFVSS